MAFLGGLSQREYRDFGSVGADGSYLLAGLKDLNRADAVPATAAAGGADTTRR